MQPAHSTRRQQYFHSRPQIQIATGLNIYVHYLEVYPESIGLIIHEHTAEELVVLVAIELEKFLNNKTIGKSIDCENCFMELVTITIDKNTINAFAKFQLAQEGYIYLIRLIYIS